MLLCIIGSICFFVFFLALMLLCSIWFLDVTEPSLAMMLLCQYYVALMFLCIGSRTFSIGTYVFVPLYGCTDVIVQHLCLVLRVLEPVVGNDVAMPLGFIDVLNPLDTVVSHFFSLSSGIVNKILSHMCGRLYFPMFLFRVGLVTLMNMASWMVLAILLSSLPRILKLSIDVIWPLMFWWWYIGEGVFKCSLNLSPKVLPDSPTYSSSQPISPQQ